MITQNMYIIKTSAVKCMQVTEFEVMEE